jgi:hypothetical protein
LTWTRRERKKGHLNNCNIENHLSRTALNFFLDLVLFTITVCLLFVSALLRFVFPPPSASAGWTLYGYGFDAWANAQFVLLCLIGVAALLHVMLHWSWVCGVVVTRLLGRKGGQAKLDDGVRTLYGVAMLIGILVLVGILLGICSLSVQPPTA